jgi:hypothetical protein
MSSDLVFGYVLSAATHGWLLVSGGSALGVLVLLPLWRPPPNFTRNIRRLAIVFIALCTTVWVVIWGALSWGMWAPMLAGMTAPIVALGVVLHAVTVGLRLGRTAVSRGASGQWRIAVALCATAGLGLPLSIVSLVALAVIPASLLGALALALFGQRQTLGIACGIAVLLVAIFDVVLSPFSELLLSVRAVGGLTVVVACAYTTSRLGRSTRTGEDGRAAPVRS